MKKEDSEVMTGENRRNSDGQPSLPYDRPIYEAMDFGDILKIPKGEDMADNVAGSYFSSDDERIAYCRIIRRLDKFHLESRKQFIRLCLASKLGMRAFGKTLQLQHKVQLIAPAVIREQLDMKHLKRGNKEDVVRKSDFRQDEVPSKEPKQEQ